MYPRFVEEGLIDPWTNKVFNVLYVC
jgi:hypothetical protein